MVEAFVRQVKVNHSSRIVLEAHAGGEGTEDEMMRLSQCRGDAVKAEIVGRGLGSDLIRVVARGSRDPWPRTADWVPTLDRRVLVYAED